MSTLSPDQAKGVMKLLGELKRRQVIRVALVYAVVGFTVGEVAEMLLDNFGAPSWAVPTVLVILLVGFPVSLMLAWAYDLTPHGVVKDRETRPEPVQEGDAGDADGEPRTTDQTVTDVAEPPVTSVPSTDRRLIAVLPFSNLSGDPENEFFCDGITDDILTALTFIEGFKVISRMSAMHYKGTAKSTKTIATELGVGAVLEGSVRRSEGRVRVVVQLIDAGTDEHIWADTYDRDLQDVFAVQSEVAESVAATLESQLSPFGKVRLASASTTNVEAYELVARARHAYLQVTPEHVEHGMMLLRRAIELDPEYAVAYAHLGIAHFVQLGFSPVSAASIEAPAREAIERAFELDDNLPEAYVARAYWRFNFRWDWDGADEDFARALEINPSFADAYQWRALMRHISRRPEEAIEDAKRSVSLDPLSFQTRNQLAQSLTWGGQPEAALAVLTEVLAEDPTNFISHWNLGVLTRPTDLAGALQHFENGLAVRNDPLGLASRSVTLRMLGRVEEADHIIGDLERRSEGPDFVSPFALAVAYFGKGDFDRGTEYLEEGAEKRDFLSLYSRLIAHAYGFHDHPRYQALLHRIWPDDFPVEQQVGV